MQVIVNGETLEFEEGMTIASLLDSLQRQPEHVAVEYNGNLVQAGDFATLRLKSSDRLEVVHFVGGG